MLAAALVALAGGCVAAAPGSAAASRGSPRSPRPARAHAGSPRTPSTSSSRWQTSLPSGQFGFAADAEYGEQVKAIDLFVNHINAAGGINGRTINPIITNFDPTNESELRALCTDWTQGSPPVFAVLDGLGTWSGDSQLCITQEGHTPFLGQWTTVSNWTTAGSPYLWWTGPDDAAIIQGDRDLGARQRPARRVAEGGRPRR